MDTPMTERTSAPVPILELHVPRNLNLASMAPSGPEIKHDYPAFVVGQTNGGTHGIVKSEGRSGLAQIGRCVGSWQPVGPYQKQDQHCISHNDSCKRMPSHSKYSHIRNGGRCFKA